MSIFQSKFKHSAICYLLYYLSQDSSRTSILFGHIELVSVPNERALFDLSLALVCEESGLQLNSGCLHCLGRKYVVQYLCSTMQFLTAAEL